MYPLVSVICICFNHEKFVKQAVHSVLNQTYKNIELIVVDNGSSDNSYKIIKEICRENPDVKFLNYPETLSLTKAFNKAFDHTKGTYLIDLSADDLLLKDCIEKQVRFFLQQPDNVGIIFGNAYHIDENGQRTAPYFKINSENKVTDTSLFHTNYQKLLAGGLCMCSVSSMITRNHFELLGHYNKELFVEDLDYWLRLSRNYEIKFLDDFLVEKRFIKNSLGNQFYKKKQFSQKINYSLRKIYCESLQRNVNKQEHRALLKRIHSGMEQSFKNQLWTDFIKFSLLELKCRFYILFK